MATGAPGALIVNADDLGIHPRINAGIFEAFEHGIVSSATMLMTTPFVSETLRELQTRPLPVGLHLSLTLGKAQATREEVPDLVDEAGVFKHSAGRLLLLGKPHARRRDIYGQIRREFDRQLTIAGELGLALTHVDSHQHVHMNPYIFEIVEELAEKHQITRIRCSREPMFAFGLAENLMVNLRRLNPVKLLLVRTLARRVRPTLKSTDWFFGLMFSGHVTRRAFERLLAHVGRRAGICELGIHPGYRASGSEPIYADPGIDAFIRSPDRESELRVLTDAGIRAAIARHGIRLISFADL